MRHDKWIAAVLGVCLVVTLASCKKIEETPVTETTEPTSYASAQGTTVTDNETTEPETLTFVDSEESTADGLIVEDDNQESDNESISSQGGSSSGNSPSTKPPASTTTTTESPVTTEAAKPTEPPAATETAKPTEPPATTETPTTANPPASTGEQWGSLHD